MWEALEIAHEGTSVIKENRINTLTTEYDLLRMKSGESIAEFELRYTHLVNQLAALGKTFEQGVQVRKILNILTSDWEAKVTAIEEARGQSMQSVAALFGSLSEYEGKQKFKKELSDLDEKKKKGLALKVVKENIEDNEDNEEIDDEEMGMIVRRFKKFYRKGPGFKRFQKGDSSQKKEKDQIICYECKKPGHIKAECPDLSKEKKKNKFRKKKAYVSSIWGDSSSDEESEAEEEANICLVAQNDEIDSDEVTTLDELQLEYNELHSEFVKVVKELVVFKKRVKEFENKPQSTCSNCILLEKKNEDLTKTIEKFTRGSEMLKVILKSQKVTRDRSGIGYIPSKDKGKRQKKQNKKAYLSYFQKSSFVSNPYAFCNHCNRKGHYTSSCSVKKYGLVRGYQWVPKGSYDPKGDKTNHKGPKKTWVPKK